MFRYAMLRGVASKRGFEVAIPFNKNISLWKFPLIAQRLNDEFVPRHVFREKAFSFNPAVFDQSDATDYFGYYQTEKYFEHIETEIRQTFTFSAPEIKEAQLVNNFRASSELVSIHVRRGDYCNNAAHADLYGAYYHNAMNLFPEAVFVIISDDLKWCRHKLKGNRIQYFQGSSMFVDMAAMATCDHHIISNSTFGWWGAWLHSSSSKRVVRPSSWWGPKTAHLEDHDICPTNWEIAPI